MKRMAKDQSLPQSFWLWRLARLTLRLLLPALAVVAVILLSAMALPWISENALPVERLELAGDMRRISSAEIEQVALPHLQQGLLMSDLQAIGEHVQLLAWVGSVQTQRIWPDTVRITVTEQQPVARWDIAEKGAAATSNLLMSDGRVVAMPAAGNRNNFTHLPEVIGSGVKGEQVVTELRQVQSILAKQNYTIKKFAVAQYGGRTLLLNDQQDEALLIKLPRQNTYAVLSTFIVNANEIFTRRLDDFMARKPASVDLRYRNGFAVRWQPITRSLKQNQLDNRHAIPATFNNYRATSSNTASNATSSATGG